MSLDGKHLETILVTSFWIMNKENSKIVKNYNKHIDKIYKSISMHKEIVAIPDKQEYINSAKEFIKSLVENDNLTDSKILEYLSEKIKNDDNENINDFLNIVCLLIYKDKKVSVEEIEALSLLQRTLDISEEELESIKNNARVSQKKKKGFIKEESHNKKRNFLVFLTLALFGICLIAFTGYSAWIYVSAKQNFSSFKMAEIVENNPKLVFKRAHFYKYIIVGTPNDAHDYFKKLSIFQVKGTADFQFDISGLSIDPKKTDYVGKILYLTYSGKNNSKFPLEIDVNIDPKDIYTLPGEQYPEAVSKQTAKKIGKAVSIPAGILGAIVGAKTGGALMSVFSLPGKFFGSILGGATGAAAAGGGAYVMTSNFFTGLQAKGLTLGEKDKIIEKSKPLIALELMGGNMFSGDSWDKKVKQHYIQQFETTLERLFGAYGWKEVRIENLNLD